MKKKDPKIESSQVAALKDGVNSPFWKTIRKIVDDERKELEYQIFEDEDITEKTRDDLRRWRNFLAYFVDLPQKCIKSLESQDVNDGSDREEDSNDPYESPLAEIREKINENGK
jgi:hypothetical protein